MIGAYVVGGLYVALVLALGLYRKGMRKKPYAGRHRSILDAITDFTSRDAATVRWLTDLNDEDKEGPKP